MPVRNGKSRKCKIPKVRQAVVSVLGSADQLFRQLWATLVVQQVAGVHSMVAIIGDGAPWIRERAKLFINRIEILDFWHAAEHAWACARVLWGDGTQQTQKWVRKVVSEIRDGEVLNVIEKLRRLQTKLTKASAPEKHLAALDALITYYLTHALRMNYPLYRSLGLSIGSGMVESAHRQIVHARMRQAGMRWSEAGARRMLLLREAYVRGAWNEIEQLYTLRAA